VESEEDQSEAQESRNESLQQAESGVGHLQLCACLLLVTQTAILAA
jgi:hypothetical protein